MKSVRRPRIKVSLDKYRKSEYYSFLFYYLELFVTKEVLLAMSRDISVGLDSCGALNRVIIQDIITSKEGVMIVSASDGHSKFSIGRSRSVEVLWVPVIPL